MNSIICTLFEGDYHYGAAALINSLHFHGFEGEIFIGYRGDIPNWAKASINDNKTGWNNARMLDVSDKIKVTFLPLTTTYHLTHYKPYFMLTLLNEVITDVTVLYYFDPDIIIKTEWNFFERWADCGVAVVHEILYNDMPPTHPIRYAWKHLIMSAGKPVVRDMHSYVNGGFLGLHIRHKAFLETWKALMELVVQKHKVDLNQWHTASKIDPFCLPDQDLMKEI